MKKKKLGKTYFVAFLTLSLVMISLGGPLADVASAASWDNQWIQVYGPNLNSGNTGDESVVYPFVWDGNGYRSGNMSTWDESGYKTGNWVPGVPNQNYTPQPSVPQTNTAPAKQPATVVPQPASQSNSGQGISGLSAEEQQAFNLLNADRVANGLVPLRINSQLVGLAEYYAQDMINRNFFSHNNPEGQTPFDRMRQRGISFGYAGENLAINTSVPAAEQAFMNSAGHRANILNPHYTQVGVGVRHSSQGGVYVVQEFTDG